jgi:hypothetical protein
MRRILVSLAAVGVANIAAPLLAWFFTILLLILLEPQDFSWSVGLDGLFLFILFGLPLIFLSVFPVSLILALIGLFFRWRSVWIYVSGGAILGLVFAFSGYDWSFPKGADDQRFFSMEIFVGCLCGWIYWRIAIRRTLEAGHAIAKP